MIKKKNPHTFLILIYNYFTVTIQSLLTPVTFIHRKRFSLNTKDFTKHWKSTCIYSIQSKALTFIDTCFPWF